ncbi:MAG: SDR family oxidoreductase [Betaproteobacteria bacterium]|nr:SDR family oxidoreductase [Betaproteobacteria bacterium]
MDDTQRMAGRIALITGGAGGIGASAGELFCAHGAKVLLVDRDADALARTAAAIRVKVPGASIEAHVADVVDPGEAQAAVRQAVAHFGALNVLVSNAAVRYLKPVIDSDPAEWQKVMSVNLMGALNFAKAALPELRKQRGASVVIVSSTFAETGRKNFGAYDASKAALLSLTRTLAAEEAAHGIRVNAVCPGGTLTPFTIGRNHAARGVSLEQMRSEGKPDSLMNRWAEAEEVAYPILFLASDEASFITGQSLMVDGGIPLPGS